MNRSSIILVLVLILFAATPVQADKLGSLTKNKSEVAFDDMIALWKAEKNELTVSMFPSKLSAEERNEILGGKSVFFTISGKTSPDQNRWRWYPYGEVTLRFKEKKEPKIDNLDAIVVTLYGAEKQNHTDNLSIYHFEKKFEKYISSLNIDTQNKSFGFKLKGPYELGDSKFQIDLSPSGSIADK